MSNLREIKLLKLKTIKTQVAFQLYSACLDYLTQLSFSLKSGEDLVSFDTLTAGIILQSHSAGSHNKISTSPELLDSKFKAIQKIIDDNPNYFQDSN